jgi:hypothetical protein
VRLSARNSHFFTPSLLCWNIFGREQKPCKDLLLFIFFNFQFIFCSSLHTSLFTLHTSPMASTGNSTFYVPPLPLSPPPPDLTDQCFSAHFVVFFADLVLLPTNLPFFFVQSRSDFDKVIVCFLFDGSSKCIYPCSFLLFSFCCWWGNVWGEGRE